jgi:hypothetical protein
MMFFWSELPRWFYALLILAVVAIAAIIFSMVRGQVSVSAGAVQYMDEYNTGGGNTREGRKVAPPGGFAPRPGDQPHNTVIDRSKPQNTPFVPSQVPETVPAPTGNTASSGRGRNGQRN